MYNAKELREHLGSKEKTDLIKVIVKCYRKNPDLQREVDLLIEGDSFIDQTRKDFNDQVASLNIQSPGFYKDLLQDYVKVIKDKKERVEAHFKVVDKLLGYCDLYEEGDIHRHLMVASSTYGKAIKILVSSPDLWKEKQEEALKLAERFAEWNYEAGYQAVTYYKEAEREMGN